VTLSTPRGNGTATAVDAEDVTITDTDQTTLSIADTQATITEEGDESTPHHLPERGDQIWHTVTVDVDFLTNTTTEDADFVTAAKAACRPWPTRLPA